MFKTNVFNTRGGIMAQNTFQFALLAGALAVAGAGNATAGASASMLADSCAGCHGTDGVSGGPAAPTIAGISEEYFIELMEGFASGEVPSTIMGRIAKGYTEDEVKAMAGYFSSKPFAKAQQEFDAKMAENGAKLHDKYCEKCHAEGGSSAEDDSGILNGQWTPYLSWTMADYISGDREATKKMKKKLDQMHGKYGEKGVQALLNFYASGK
jgi:sulfide dehydrogenase cytochrome subunit